MKATLDEKIEKMSAKISKEKVKIRESKLRIKEFENEIKNLKLQKSKEFADKFLGILEESGFAADDKKGALLIEELKKSVQKISTEDEPTIEEKTVKNDRDLSNNLKNTFVDSKKNSDQKYDII